MEAGVAFFLLLILVVLAAVAGLFFYLGGAAMWMKGGDSEAGEQSRPTHVETGRPTEARIFPSGDGTGDRDGTRNKS
jgi:hypothetical protein